MRKYLLFLFVMMVAASCGTAPPEETDWCWTFDFRASDNTFSIASGAQVNNYGLYSGAGVLSFSYQHPTFVEPVLAAITVVRPDGITGDIPISAIGTVFGSSASFSVTMPSTSNRETRWFQPTTEGNAGTDVNVTIDVGSQEIIIESIRIEGNGETPFDHNQCTDPEEGPTFTPTQTNTPTQTPTATDTPTPTDTPTATDTPIPTSESGGEWCVFLDFRLQPYNGGEGIDIDLGVPGWGSGWVDGLGYSSVDFGGTQELNSIRLNFDSSIPFTYFEFYVDITQAFDANQFTAVFGTDILNGTWDRVDNLNPTGISSDFSHVGYDDVAYSTTSIRVSGNPYVANPYYYYAIELGGTGAFPFPLLEDNCDLDTPTPTTTSTTTITPPVIPTNTPFNWQPTVDLTQTTATPSITPTQTSTDYPQSTTVPFELTLTVGANTPTYSVEEIRENEAEWELLQEQQESNNAIQNLLQDILDAINDGNSSGSGDGGEAGGESGTGEGDTIIGGVSDWYSAVSDSLYTVQGLFGRVSIFFGQAANGANSLVNAFYTAPPSPIPGLPRCMSAPLEHDICAVYYILDWTLFAPNTLGQFIVPLIWAIMNVIIIFRVLGYVLKLIKRTEDVTR